MRRTMSVLPGDPVRVVAGGAVCWDVLDVDRAQDLRVPGGTPALAVGRLPRTGGSYTADCVRVLLPGLGLRWIRRLNLRRLE